MFKLLKLCVLLLLFSSCQKDDDETMLCSTGPVTLELLIIEESTGENLIAEGVYTRNQISISDQDEKAVDFQLNEQGQIGLLLGWEEKSDIFSVRMGEEIEFNISFSLEERSSKNCTNTFLKELSISDFPYERSEETGIITVLVERGE